MVYNHPVDNRYQQMIWGRSSAGRAPHWQCGGQEFDPLRLHQMKPSVPLEWAVFLYFFGGLRFSKILFGVYLVLMAQKTRAFPRWERPFVMPAF